MAWPLETKKQLAHDDYTVAWICALPIEKTAARNMLDELHITPPQPDHDKNIYTFGRICGHNVVIVCQGDMGTTAAGIVATRMNLTFRKLRFGLLVGIAGGVPDGRDVRLGDVVISKGDGRSGGVVAHDRGKETPSGFESQPFLDGVPELLRNAFAELESRLMDQDSKIAEYLSKATARNPRFSVFERPASLSDNLFRSEYPHVNPNDKRCAECNKDYVMARDPRDGPVLHFGLVASGNQVIKNGVKRRKILEAHPGVIAVEMEAAGLMSVFGCATIRGICDYADSHKNDGWHKYASAVAAAAAKEVLGIIPSTMVVAAPAISLSEPPGVNVSFSLKGVPLVNTFVAREEELSKMEQFLCPAIINQRRNILVLHGLGGIGKTQLALEYARRHQNDYSAVFWLDGKTRDTLKQYLAAIAERLPQGQTTESARHYTKEGLTTMDDIIREVLAWFGMVRNKKWLLIYDNVDGENSPDAYDVREYFPHCDQGSIIITTRQVYLCQLGSELQVGKVNAKQGLQILANSLGRSTQDIPDALRIVERLDGHPLALAQAGCYMRESNSSVSTYLEFYNNSWLELMKGFEKKGQPLHDYGNGTIFTTWKISHERIMVIDESAAMMLQLWAYFDNRDIWFELFAFSNKPALLMNETIPGWFTEVTESKFKFKAVTGVLLAYSLIEARFESESYSIHPVLQDWCLEYLGNAYKGRNELWALAVKCVGFAVPSASAQNYWLAQHRLLLHANRCSALISSHFDERVRRGCDTGGLYSALDSIGSLYLDQGKLREAQTLYQLALAGKESELGPEDPSTLRTVNNIGLLWSRWGELDEAESMYQRALTGREKVLGRDDKSTLNTVRNMGNLYRKQGRLEEAEDMYQRALVGFGKILGSTDISTLDVINSLGNLYQEGGKQHDAQGMYQLALSGYENALGREHTSTLDTINNLGSLYSSQGRFGKAEKMYRRALAGYGKALGEQHPSSLRTVTNLGNLYRDFEKFDDAEAMYTQALTGYEGVLGRGHPLTVHAAANLLYLLQKKSGSPNPKATRERKSTLFRESENPGLADETSIENEGRKWRECAELYGRQGERTNLAEAEAMYQRALVKYEASRPAPNIPSAPPKVSQLADREYASRSVPMRIIIGKKSRERLKRMNLYASALQKAASSGHDSVVRLLLRDGMLQQKGWVEELLCESLHLAAKNGYVLVVELLLNAGARADSLYSSSDANNEILTSQSDMSEPWEMSESWEMGKPLGMHFKDSRVYETALHVAVKGSHEAVVKLFLRKGIHTAGTDTGGRTALHLAVMYGLETIVQLLLENGADIEARNRAGQTALHLAVAYKHETIVRLLLENGGNTETQNTEGRTALHIAAENGQEALAQLLLAFGANRAAQDYEGMSPLHLIAKNGHEALAPPLLAAELNTTKRDRAGQTVLHLAVKYGRDAVARLYKGISQLHLIAKNGHEALAAELNTTRDRAGQTVLHLAVRYGRDAVARLVLDQGAITAVRDNDGMTPLHLAAKHGNQAGMLMLLEKGADMTIHDSRGRSPLYWAVAGGHERLVRLLLKNGASANDAMALHEATARGHKAIVHQLLDRGAIADAESLHGAARGGFESLVRQLLKSGAVPGAGWLEETAREGHEGVIRLLLNKETSIKEKYKDELDVALRDAAARGHEATARLLLEKGARLLGEGAGIEVKNSALLQAAAEGHTVKVQLLLEMGADIDARGWHYQRTALHVAAIYGHSATIQLLLKMGADVNATDEDGWTALCQAQYSGSHTVVDFLRN